MLVFRFIGYLPLFKTWSTNYFCLFCFVSFYFACVHHNSETPVVEKEVVEVDAPKVVDEEAEVVENGNGEEAVAAEEPVVEKTEENGTEKKTEETTEDGTPAEEVDVQNGDSTGKLIWQLQFK